MKEYEYLDELISRYPVLAPVKADIRTAYEMLKECYERGGKAPPDGGRRKSSPLAIFSAGGRTVPLRLRRGRGNV